jgi:hypothetical protein
MVGVRSQEPERAACLLDHFLREPGGISVRSRHFPISSTVHQPGSRRNFPFADKPDSVNEVHKVAPHRSPFVSMSAERVNVKLLPDELSPR